MTLQEVVAQFNTTPFIFAGSGLTRRYYGLPDWVGLLKHFAALVSADRFAYRAYENRANNMDHREGLLPTVATLIEQDFNSKWFNPDGGIRSNTDRVLRAVDKGVSPFKAEIANYIYENSQVNPRYNQEILKLKNISKKNITGVITTNYDMFFENMFPDYTVFIGQDQLVFSPLQEIAEIYKIHGSVDQPGSLVINENDYSDFYRKGKYLAAKLMTIFMEYPIIFIGYSLSDRNIQNILSDIMECLPPSRISTLQRRFVFVEYVENADVEISLHSMSLNGNILQMTKVSIGDFGLLYDALAAKKAAFPVKILRRFKEDLYSFAITNHPENTLKVAALDDARISDDRLALTIGLAQTGVYGLARSVDANEWYRDVVLHDLPYSSDDLLQYAYPEIKRQNAKLPVYKYLSQASKDFPEIRSEAPQTYSEIVSPTASSTRNNQTAISSYDSAKELWLDLRGNRDKAIRLLGFMPEEKVCAADLQEILLELFRDNPDVLSQMAAVARSNLRKVIRMYDYLMWK